MCKDCLRGLRSLLPNASEEELGDFAMSATCFPFGDARQVYYSARRSLRAGGFTIRGAIRYANLELDRQMRKFRSRERAQERA
jgi:hypothetical protein